jgi:hypothetical protein
MARQKPYEISYDQAIKTHLPLQGFTRPEQVGFRGLKNGWDLPGHTVGAG